MRRLLLSSAILLALASPALAQTATAVILPNGFTQFLDANGKPLASGTVYFYVPSTTTPKTTWQDPYQVIVNPNPITLNASGEALIWGNGIYREQVYDINSNLIWDQLTGGYNCIGGGTGSPGGSANQIQYNVGGVSFGGLALGTSTTLLHGNASGVATWGAVNLGTDLTGGGTGVITALGINTNAAGGLTTKNGSIVSGDCLEWTSSGITDSGGACPPAGSGVPAGGANQLQYNNSGVFGALSQGVSTQVLHGNASGLPTWSQVAIATDVGGLGSGVATILAAGSTGTGNLVAATAPTLALPAANAYTSAGTAPTVSGSGGTCAGAATAGAQTSVGTITLSGACAASNTIALSAMPAVPHSYVCFASDRTQPATLLYETTGTTTGATLTVSGTTSGSTDVIQYSCMGF